MNPLFACVITAAIMTLPLRSGAELVFEETTIKKTPKLEQTEVDYAFRFKATGTRPVRIKELRALCDCLKLRADRMEYQPGDLGIIQVRLQIGVMEGSVAKSFNVITDQAAQPKVLLRCEAQIPRLFEFSPLATTWKVGETPHPKTVLVKVLGEKPMHILSVKATGRNITPAFKEIEEGRSYEIVLHPKQTDKVEAGMVKIKTSSPIKKYAERFLYFHVVPDRGQASTVSQDRSRNPSPECESALLPPGPSEGWDPCGPINQTGS